MAPPALTTVRARTLFTPLDTGGRADTVTRRLANAIRLGLLLDGERLPAESQLAGQLGVSTVTLREALATLRTMGLVETRRGRGGGSFVRAPHDADRLERPLRLLSLHELRRVRRRSFALRVRDPQLLGRGLDPRPQGKESQLESWLAARTVGPTLKNRAAHPS